jgi:hypothetical protein
MLGVRVSGVFHGRMREEGPKMLTGRLCSAHFVAGTTRSVEPSTFANGSGKLSPT